MRIVHLCTIDFGGAAVAAQRLHYGLIREGIDSSILFLNVSNPNQFPNKYKFDDSIKLTIIDRIKRRLGIPATQRDKNRRMIKGIKGEYEIFSFPLTDYRVENHPLVLNADIVNLHWVSNFINYPTFFKNLKKPIIWTLHDMNSLLGGFHYQGDVERNKDLFGHVEDFLRRKKVMDLEKAYDLAVVTPSKWLGEKLHLNEVLYKKGYSCIPYGLDTSIFKPHNVSFARSVFNLPCDKKIILFVSENLKNYRKGFDLLVNAIEGLDLGENSVIVTIGNGPIETIKKSQVISLGKISDDRLMSLLYAASDIFVLPSREDNFPNVMLESMACGTPVMAFSTGGMSEVIKNDYNGILIDQLTVEALRKALLDFILGKFVFDRTAIRNFAVENFDLHIQATRYIEIYREKMRGR